MVMLSGQTFHLSNGLLANALLLSILLIFGHFPPTFAGLGRFLHVTDLHIDPQYDARAGDAAQWCHRTENSPKNSTDENATLKLGPYGDHKCDSPVALVDYMLNEAKQQLAQPDFIIWTGDSLPHGKSEEPKPADLLAMVRNASDTLRIHFPGVPVVPALGNHDSAPANTFTDHPRRQQIYEEIFELWKEWITERDEKDNNGTGAKSTFARGGYYRLQLGQFGTFLVLNTNIYYRYNRAPDGLADADDPTGQFAFLKAQLEWARGNGTPVHILGHIPPGAFEMYFWNKSSMEQMPERYNKQLVDLIVEYADQIRWMFFGHYHTDTFRIIKNSAGKPIQRFFASPAITPVIELNNPAFRIVEYNTTSLELIDIKTYSVDLDELNRNGAGRTRARLEYSMRDAYGGADEHALHSVVQLARKNDTLFAEVVRYNRVGYVQKELNATERAFHLCALENVDLGQLEKCMAENDIPLNSARIYAIPSVLMLLALILLLIF